MKGTVCVVTGATSGIGKAAATALARLGATVVLVGRDHGRTEAAAAEIAPVSASPPRAEVADLASLEQVRGLAGRLDGLERIDVLINNAGLVLGERRITPDGLEHMFALNHLAPFLLTSLLPKLTASAPARVVTVTSDAHSAARLDLNDPNLEHGWGQLAFLRQQQAGQHLVHARACPQAGRHRGDGQLRAPGGGADGLRPGVQTAAKARHHDRPAVHAVARARRGHHRLPGQLARCSGPDRGILRQASRRPPRATTRPRGNCGSSARS
jgi:NAD(P)-dependent dehydrogenase (short-subunit alcohol dehydrogenase family)